MTSCQIRTRVCPRASVSRRITNIVKVGSLLACVSLLSSSSPLATPVLPLLPPLSEILWGTDGVAAVYEAAAARTVCFTVQTFNSSSN